jgi:AcrR family transcriptional regulator
MKNQPSPPEKQLRPKILEGLASYLLAEGKAPASVALLCKELKLKEPAFYTEFASLEAAQKAIWKDWIDQLIAALSSGAEWESFSAKERYLAFLFSFTQAALEHRSLLLLCFSKKGPHETHGQLAGLKHSFKEFTSGLVEHGRESGEIADRGPLLSIYPEVLYLHWRWVLDFYLKDESEGFERTDAFIEKTVGLAFDLFRSQAIDAAADLVRFLLPKSSGFKGMGGS